MKGFLFAILLIPFLVGAQHGTIKLEIKSMPPLPATDIVISQFINSIAETRRLTEEQKDWFYWTNYSRRNPRIFWDSVIVPLIKMYPEFHNSYSTSLKKDLYAASSLPLLKPSNILGNVAQQHADALQIRKASPSHTSPDGSTFEQRMQKANIQRCAGENISFGPSNVVLALVLLYLDEGVPDLGHRYSLLNPSFTEMGIGVSPYANNRIMVVQDFSCLQKL